MKTYSVYADLSKKYRYCLLYTQQQFADYLGVSLATIKKWESGTVRIPPKWLFAFQADLNVRLADKSDVSSRLFASRVDSSRLLDLLSQAADCSIPFVDGRK